MESSGQTPVLTPLGSQPPSTPIVTLPAVQWLQSTHPVLADAVSGLPVDITPLREILNQPNSSDASNALGAVLAALADHANSQQINLDVQRASLDATSRELADMKLQRLADENTARDLINQLTEAQSSLTASKSSCEEQGRQLQEAAQRLREAADVTDVLRQQLNVAQAQASEAINVAATLRQELGTPYNTRVVTPSDKSQIRCACNWRRRARPLPLAPCYDPNLATPHRSPSTVLPAKDPWSDSRSSRAG